jgi:hypothetical protein
LWLCASHIVFIIIVVTHKHERPPLNFFRNFIVLKFFEVLKDLPLLLISAAKAVVLVFVLLHRSFRLGNYKPTLSNFIPVDIREKLVSLNLIGPFWAGTKPPTRVAIEQMNDQILGLERHAHWKLQNASLNIVEELGPIKISKFHDRHK